MSNFVHCVVFGHDLRLIMLAVVICMLASFTTVTLIARSSVARRRAALAWIGAASVVFGCGVWSLHFVAMLAFMPQMRMSYDMRTTLASVLVVVFGSVAALLVWRFVASRRIGAGLGGIMLALSIAGMHSSGVSAIRLQGQILVAPEQILLSILIGIAFACRALWRADRLVSTRRRLEVSATLALCGLSVHFIGMAALSVRETGMGASDGVFKADGLALIVGCVSLAILAASLVAALIEQHLSQRSVLELHRMRLLSDLCREIIIIHRGGRILEINAAGCRLTGRAGTELVGSSFIALFIEPDQAVVARCERHGPENRRPQEVQIRTAGGGSVPVELTSSSIDHEGRPATAVALTDLSERKRDEEQIRYLAHHDGLTDLPNRFLLQERLSHMLDVAARGGSLVALLFIDLDRFKPVNDCYGHAAGDALLGQVARRLRAGLRQSDTLARIGGDEFVLAMALDRPEPAALAAERLIESLGRPFMIAGHEIRIGASIGIGLYPKDGGCRETLMHAADTALYRAKEERNIFCFFDVEMDEISCARRQLDQDLRQALQNHQFHLDYQPIVSCVTNAVEGYEALLRWNHPVRGLISPAEFIPLAEDTGLIVRIGQWVLETACAAALTFPEPLWVAVNVSPVQFRQGDLAQFITNALARTGLPPERLEIEITETVFIDNPELAVARLASLRDLGVRLALDDFGTGYSSLSYLRSFSFDKLKIDRSFIKGMHHNVYETMIVRTIIGLAHNLGLRVVAEGVETEQQLSIVRELACDQAQGYLLGRPRALVQPIELAVG